MKLAFIVYNGLTMLDLIGMYDPITRLRSKGFIPELSWDFCAYEEPVKDNFGLEIKATKVGTTLDSYDMIFIPGGYGTRPLVQNEGFLSWIRTASSATYKTSVCTGSLILGAAGFLIGKKATTHFNEYESLAPYCQTVIKERIVEDDMVITAGAVASSLDLGLFICEKLAGKNAAIEIRKSMSYR